MSKIVSFCMFFLSFTPLWVSIIFVDLKSILDGSANIGTEIISLILIISVELISLVVLWITFSDRSCKDIQSCTLIYAKEEKTITSEFLLSYILPLFAFNFTVWNEVILFLIFFAVFTFLCIYHNHFSVNIILDLVGYRFYCCVLQNEDHVKFNKTVISKKVLSTYASSEIQITPINNEYCLHVAYDKAGRGAVV